MTDPRRRLPAVHALVASARAAGVGDALSDSALTDVARGVIASARAGTPPADWNAAIAAALTAARARTLRRVINATGVVLHTNLGRAPLAPQAMDAMREAAGYAALEVDLASGERGHRQDHTTALLTRLTGAEDALVVNNAASALLLILGALAKGGETIVARGELVEIGGGFRLPEVLAQSGTVLMEVGTTNRTRLADYEAALSARTRCVLRMHRSNFQITGFTSEPDLRALAELTTHRGLPLIHDVGSGLLLDLSRFGLTGEPLVTDSVRAGAITVFSGDKLLGGPQAGLIVGPTAWLTRLRTHPLARALRPDKTVFAGLEATLRLYGDPATVCTTVPVLAMLTADPAELTRRARRLARRIPGSRLMPGQSEVGGGSFPGAELPTTLVALSHPSPDILVTALRHSDVPIVARVADQHVLFDVRTLADGEVPVVAAAVATALES